MRSLLDVNLLLALLDADHVDHARARDFIDQEIEHGWSSCPITQNGFVRVITQPRYPSPVSPSLAVERLTQACSTPHHAFWACDFSLLDPEILGAAHLHGPRQITDAYLLAVAVRHGGRFVTFDRPVQLDAVTGATSDHLRVL